MSIEAIFSERTQLLKGFNWVKKNKMILYFLFLLIMLILPYLLISLFNHPTADDFCTYNFANKQNIFQYIYRMYIMWSGRYSLFFIMYFVSMFELLSVVKYVPIILILLHLHSTYFLFQKVLNNYSNKKAILSLTLIICFLFYSLTPSLSQSLYWLASISSYFLSCIAMTYYIGMIYGYVNTKYSFLKNVIIVLLAIIIVGLNEGSLLSVLVLTLIFYFTNFKYLGRDKFLIGLLLILTAYQLKQ